MKNKEQIINTLTFLSPATKDYLRIFCPQLASDEFFQSVEVECKRLVLTRIKEHDNMLSSTAEENKKAKALIERIKYFHSYSLHKGARMRFTKNEFDYGMNRLEEEEQKKVIQWLEDNGGIDKYILT